jgi:hypothetical protein
MNKILNTDHELSFVEMRTTVFVSWRTKAEYD